MHTCNCHFNLTDNFKVQRNGAKFAKMTGERPRDNQVGWWNECPSGAESVIFNRQYACEHVASILLSLHFVTQNIPRVLPHWGGSNYTVFGWRHMQMHLPAREMMHRSLRPNWRFVNIALEAISHYFNQLLLIYHWHIPASPGLIDSKMSLVIKKSRLSKWQTVDTSFVHRWRRDILRVHNLNLLLDFTLSISFNTVVFILNVFQRDVSLGKAK